MLTRVPTYANYMNLSNMSMNAKASVDYYSYQSVTGYKSQDYAGYGSETSTIIDVESALMVNKQFEQNNTVKQIELKAMENAIESMHDVMTNLESVLSEFASMDLENLSPDYTGGELTFDSNNFNDYVGETVTINGNTYTFTNGDDTGNNIDISDTANATEILNDLKTEIDASGDKKASEYKYDGNKMEFPNYTIDEPSTLLNNANITTGKPYIPENEITLQKDELQSQAFVAMTQLADLLNTNVNGKFLFGGENQSQPPVDFPYTTLEEFQEVFDGKGIDFPEYKSALNSDKTFDNNALGNLEIETSATDSNIGIIRSANAGAFLTPEITTGSSTTGDITFNATENSMRAQNNDSFNNLEPGDIIVIEGTDAAANEKSYLVKEVSEDGKTVIFDDSTPIAANLGPIANGGNISISSTFPKDTVIKLNGIGSDVPQKVQVMGVSDDGTELIVKIEDADFPANGTPKTVASTTNYEIFSEPYTKSTNSSNEHRINENQVIANNVDAGDDAFMEMFMALGNIAQDNFVFDADPSKGETIDPAKVRETTRDAQNMIDVAMGKFSKEQAKVISDLTVLNTALENQEKMETQLTQTLVDVKQVDKEEAALKLLMAKNQLDISYSVIKSVSEMSLLNYL